MERFYTQHQLINGGDASMSDWAHSLLARKERGLGDSVPDKFLKTTPFTLAINATNAIFSVIKAVE